MSIFYILLFADIVEGQLELRFLLDLIVDRTSLCIYSAQISTVLLNPN